MCGIVAVAAKKNIVPVLIEGLKKLEYRGYDSADRVRQALAILDRQPRGEDRLLRLVDDYTMPNVSDKVVRIIHSYTDYVNRVVWKKY